MDDIASLSLHHLAMETAEFSADPWSAFADARALHPWLAACTFGYVVHDYHAIRDLLGLDADLRTAHDQIVGMMDARGTPWGRFQEEMILAYGGADHTRLRDILAPAFTPRQANRLRRELAGRPPDRLGDALRAEGDDERPNSPGRRSRPTNDTTGG